MVESGDKSQASLFEKEHDDMLWRKFINLGDRLGDGDAEGSERAWLNREYKRLSKILVPEIREAYQKRRKAKADNINEQMAKLLSEKTCACGGALEQARSGSKICYCTKCNARYKAGKK